LTGLSCLLISFLCGFLDKLNKQFLLRNIVFMEGDYKNSGASQHDFSLASTSLYGLLLSTRI
jgi:hypothetical protein